MKQITKIIIIIIVLFGSMELRGQSCIKDISTNSANPINNEFESLYPSYTNPWKNIFNVGLYSLQSFSPIYLNPNAGWQGLSGGGYTMSNPFDGSNGYEYLSKPGQIPGVKDFHWEDGWELMWLGIGYYPNGEGIHTANANRIVQYSFAPANPRVPYMTYYNRYTGRLRVFKYFYRFRNISGYSYFYWTS